MKEQEKVVSFISQHEIEISPEYRLLDLVSELGEVSKDAVKSTEYGENPDDLTISADEIGDVLFALLALATALDIDASDALDEALDKYDNRLQEAGTLGSGE